MQRKEPKKGGDKIIYFDFESRQESGKHEMNFGIAKVRNETVVEYYGINDYGVWKLEPKFNLAESDQTNGLQRVEPKLEMFTMDNFKITKEHVPGILE